MDSQEILNSTETYLQKCVAPHAEIIDSNSEALRNSSCWIGRSIALSIASSPKMGRR
ncbi:hypothetical protein [Microcoleus vaginatus]|uniref:hypothetical protein n=1 Tax=Microcoleus vaginatus TaxID=119532 RepID=UPI00403EFF21